MLIQFTIGNFLSFKDPVTLSMVASAKREHNLTNLFKIDKKLKLLKSSVIYGANASGKSNLIKALSFMRKFVFISSKEMQATEEIPVTNFKLSTETENKPSFFEIIFIHEGVRYKYGFEADNLEIHKEWLYDISNKEEKLFTREKNTFDIGTSFSKEGDESNRQKTRKNALFLSVTANFNGEISTKILTWFKKLKIVSGLDDNQYGGFTLDRIKDIEFKNKVLNFLKIADFGIEDVSSKELKINRENLPKNMPEELKSILLEKEKELIGVKVQTFHKKFNTDKTSFSLEEFDLDDESEGTQKFFALSGPILDTLKNGHVLIIDELDSRLHPILTKEIIKLFNSFEFNSSNAQLIFASHDTNLLNKDLFRRDQIWFTEKDKYGATDLHSLVEFKEVRNDATYNKDYILGKYGAIPFIGNFRNLFNK